MADDRDSSSDDDLFEDLDEFFAPLEEGEWPGEGEEASEPRAPEPQATPPPGTEHPEGEVDLDFEVDLGTDDLAEEFAEASEEEGPAAPVESVDDLEGVGSPAEEAQPWVEEATSEMAGADWEAMRGEAAGAAEPEHQEEAPSDLTYQAPGTGAAADEDLPPLGEAPLSADDLAAAPPQYADLPGDEEDLLDEGEEESVLAEEATFDAPEGAEPLVTFEPEEAPEEAAVEAAAEHFASGIRESPEDVERELLADLEESDEELQTVRVDAGAAEAEAPPVWEEGPEAAVEEVSPEVPPPPGRNLTAAFITGGALAVLVLVLIAIDKGPFAVFAGAVILAGQGELYAVLRTKGYQPATLMGLVCGALILAGGYLHGEAALAFGLFLAMGMTVLWYMAAPPGSRKGTVLNVGATLLGVVYVPFLASFAFLLLRVPGVAGRNMLLVVIGLTILYDICAFAIGSVWGNRPLAPTVSPQKSWEGAIGATLILLLVALSIVPQIDPFDASRAVGLALVIAVVAPLGDLVESAIKRDLGVKDMGTILPGHGGILDRVDAILFTAPAAYFFLRIAFL